MFVYKIQVNPFHIILQEFWKKKKKIHGWNYLIFRILLIAIDWNF